jgi:predicted PurR-regulated permease PerM
MKFFTKRSGVTINVSTEAIIRALVLVVVTVFLLRFVGKVGHQLELFGVAAFLALALNPAVTRLSKRLHIKSRVWATGLAYIVVLIILTGFLALVVPPLVRQTSTFVHNIPSTLNTFKDQNSSAGRLIERYHLQPQISKLGTQLSSRLSDTPSFVFSAAGTAMSVVVAVITIIVLTFMMLVEGPLWADRFYVLLPDDRRDTYKDLAKKMYHVITGYVNGQVLIAALASFCSFIMLTIASHFTHVTVNAVAMACIVFLFGLIPLIGNTIAAVIVVIICAFSSIPLAIVMAIYFPIYQQTENSTLQPHIQAKNNQLTPLLVFMAALLGAGFGGLLGAFVAIPAAGCLRILFEYHYGDKLAPTAAKVTDSKE